jgi:hypothetical protein
MPRDLGKIERKQRFFLNLDGEDLVGKGGGRGGIFASQAGKRG